MLSTSDLNVTLMHRGGLHVLVHVALCFCIQVGSHSHTFFFFFFFFFFFHGLTYPKDLARESAPLS